MLTLDAVKHEYREGGVLIPSVTQILAPLSNFEFVHPEVLAAAQQFGTAVHLACELDDLGKLNTDSLDSALMPYLNGWRKFSRDYAVSWEAIESRVYSPTLRYAGTLDRAGLVSGKKAIVDIKSGTSLLPTVGPQLAAYANAYSPIGRSMERYAVRLYPDGYELKQYTSQSDWPVFASLITLRSFCARNRITPNFKEIESV